MLVLNWPVLLGTSVALALLSYWVYWRWANRRMLRLAAKIPGPLVLPIIGNAHIFIAKPEELLDVMSSLMKSYGEYCKFWLGSQLNICVKNPRDIRLLLTSNKVNKKGPNYDIMKPFIGPGILTGGEEWRNHRKIATPSYNKKSVQHFLTVFNEEARQLARVLMTRDPGNTFDVYHDVLEATTQSVCQTLMGLSKIDSTTVTCLKEVIAETPNMYSLIFFKMTRWWYQIPLIYWLIGGNKKECYYHKILDEMTTDIITKRKKALEGHSTTSTDKDNDNKVLGAVDRFILSGEMSEQEIKWETFSLFTTSQEASAKIASGLFLFLAHLPDWQNKVYNEIIDVLGPRDDYVTEDELKKLLYLDMVYKEVLRYLSIAAMIQRTVEEDVAINNGNIILPKGTSLVIPIHELHRDPRYWDQPNKVMPERFLPENSKDRDPNAFVPFSLGPMDCLGRVYATALIKTLVVWVLRHVRLEADGNLEDLDIHVAISVRFANGYNLRVKRRHAIN